MSDDIILCKSPPGLLRWNDLFKATVNEDSDDTNPYFRATVIFDKAAQATPEYQGMKEAAARAMKEEWGDKPPANLRSPFRPGTDKDLEKFPEFGDGVTFINVKTKKKPGIVAAYIDPATGKPKIIADDTEIYNGCKVRLSMTVYAYKVKGNAGVSFGLRNVQKLEDGTPFSSGGIKAEDDFDAVDGATNPNDIFG